MKHAEFFTGGFKLAINFHWCRWGLGFGATGSSGSSPVAAAYLYAVGGANGVMDSPLSGPVDHNEQYTIAADMYAG